jgi:hypothetical protein
MAALTHSQTNKIKPSAPGEPAHQALGRHEAGEQSVRTEKAKRKIEHV